EPDRAGAKAGLVRDEPKRRRAVRRPPRPEDARRGGPGTSVLRWAERSRPRACARDEASPPDDQDSRHPLSVWGVDHRRELASETARYRIAGGYVFEAMTAMTTTRSARLVRDRDGLES